MTEISFDLAGLYYRTESQKEEAYNLKIGDELKIKQDLLNGNDDFALKIFSRGKFIGYVPKSLSREVTLLLWRYDNYKLEVEDYNHIENVISDDDDYCISLKLHIDKTIVIQFSDDWYTDKNFIIEGVFQLTNKNDIAYFIQKNNGVVKKTLNNSIDGIILGQHHISLKRMENISKLTKSQLVVISEEEIIRHYENNYKIIL